MYFLPPPVPLSTSLWLHTLLCWPVVLCVAFCAAQRQRGSRKGSVISMVSRCSIHLCTNIDRSQRAAHKQKHTQQMQSFTLTRGWNVVRRCFCVQQTQLQTCMQAAFGRNDRQIYAWVHVSQTDDWTNNSDLLINHSAFRKMPTEASLM